MTWCDLIQELNKAIECALALAAPLYHFLSSGTQGKMGGGWERTDGRSSEEGNTVTESGGQNISARGMRKPCYIDIIA